MKFAGLRYDVSGNLGDEIQSIAADRFLPRIDKRFDRDSLALARPNELYLIILNGWYSHFPRQCFVPNDGFRPIIYGFHISNWHAQNIEHFLSPTCIEYFKANGPVGCRDRRTCEMLQEKGVDAFLSGCVTLTLDRRETEPAEPRTFFVDAKGVSVPEPLARHAVWVSHEMQDIFGPPLKRAMAERLLAVYRENAGLVVTKRLHCALPCIAMGIPVVFLGDPDDYRLSPLKEIGLPIYKNGDDIEWAPKPLDIDRVRDESLARLNAMIAERLKREGYAAELADE